MDVQLQLDLNEEEERGFKDLILLCNQEDKTNYDTALDYDFFYSIRNEEKKESGLKEDYLAILMGYKLGEQEEGEGYSALYCVYTSLYARARTFYHA